MAYIRKGYINVDERGRLGKKSRKFMGKNIFLVSHLGNAGYISIGNTGTISFPKSMIGKRVSLKVEIIDDNIVKERMCWRCGAHIPNKNGWLEHDNHDFCSGDCATKYDIEVHSW